LAGQSSEWDLFSRCQSDYGKEGAKTPELLLRKQKTKAICIALHLALGDPVSEKQTEW